MAGLLANIIAFYLLPAYAVDYDKLLRITVAGPHRNLPNFPIKYSYLFKIEYTIYLLFNCYLHYNTKQGIYQVLFDNFLSKIRKSDLPDCFIHSYRNGV